MKVRLTKLIQRISLILILILAGTFFDTYLPYKGVEVVNLKKKLDELIRENEELRTASTKSKSLNSKIG